MMMPHAWLPVSPPPGSSYTHFWSGFSWHCQWLEPTGFLLQRSTPWLIKFCDLYLLYFSNQSHASSYLVATTVWFMTIPGSQTWWKAMRTGGIGKYWELGSMSNKQNSPFISNSSSQPQRKFWGLFLICPAKIF